VIQYQCSPVTVWPGLPILMVIDEPPLSTEYSFEVSDHL
jgi:hypothetical protein